MATRPIPSRAQLGGALLLSWLPVSAGFLAFFYFASRDTGVLVTGQAFFVATVASFVAASLAVAVLADAMGLHRGVGATIGLLYGGALYALSRSPALVTALPRAEYAVGVPGTLVMSAGTVIVGPTVALLLGYFLLWTSDASFRSLGNGHVGIGFSGYTVAILAVLFLPLQLFLFAFIQYVGWDCVVYFCATGPGLVGVGGITAAWHAVALPVCLPGLVGATRALLGRGGSAGDEVTATGTTSADESGPDSWPQPGHDAAKTAAVPDEPGLASAPGTAWQTLPDGEEVVTAPAVAHGVALAVTDDCVLVAVDATTGDLEWTADLDGEHPTPPAVTSRVVYVGTDAGIHAHRVADGEHRWSEAVGPVETLTAGDVVYASTDDSLVALRPVTGNRKWTTRFDRPIRAVAVHGATAVGPLDDIVYAATDEDVVALSPATGGEQWRAASPGRAPRLALGRDLVVSGRGGLRALDPATGDEQWHDDTGGDPTPVAVAHGRVYQTTDTAVRAVDNGTGAESWRTTIDAATPPVVVGDTVYVGTETELVALDAAEDDTYAFTHDIDGAQSTLAVAENAVFLSTVDGALTTVTGELGDEPTLTGTTATTSEAASGATAAANRDQRSVETVPVATTGDTGNGTESNATERVSVADRFARDCTAVVAASVVDETGPVHVYEGRFVDDVGEVDARVYALAPGHADDEQACAAFVDAAREWQGIGKNTHVVTVFGTGSDPRPWVAFDAGTGRLDDTLTGLDRQERREVVGDLAEAIRTAGMYNVVHGGIDPETVYLVADDQQGRAAALADWGLHRAVADAVGDEAGVTPYTAPEQLDGETAGTRTDIYRLGALATYTLTDEPPFPDAADLSAAIRDAARPITEPHVDTLAPTVASAIREATTCDPDERMASAYAFKQELLATGN